MKNLTIGDITLMNNLILAPMAGVCDLPFRLLCKEQGAGMVCMEMVSAKALTFHNKNTESMLTVQPDEKPVSLQLFGSEPKVFSDAVRLISDRPFDILDINMGCPVPKVVNNHEGSALMNQPELVGRIVEACVKETTKPVTVKIRKGFNESSVNAVEIAKIAEEAGAKAVAVHGRTREQYYAGEADWDIIRRVKEAVRIPVIGNGDVTDGESAVRLMKETGCDGVMIGRASRGNPWIFGQIAYYMENGEQKEKPSREEVREMILRHARLQISYQGENPAIREMRKHVAWYTAGYPNSSKVRRAVNEATSMKELTCLVDDWLKD